MNEAKQTEAAYFDLINKVESFEKSVSEAQKAVNQLCGTDINLQITQKGNSNLPFSSTIEDINVQVWQAILNGTDIPNMVPFLAPANILNDITNGYPAPTEQAVEERLNSVERHINKYIAQQAMRLVAWTPSIVNMPVVLKVDVGAVKAKGKSWSISQSHEVALHTMEDLFRIFDVGARDYRSEDTLMRAFEKQGKKGSTFYFEYELFAVGSLHIKFKHRDLLAKLCEIITNEEE